MTRKKSFYQQWMEENRDKPLWYRVRLMIRRSRWPGFLVNDLTDLADQAGRNGLATLPISIYRPGHHKGQRWLHSTITTA